MNNRRNRPARTRAATIKDVALEAGVSPMTVSRVINGKANVRPATRQRIERAIRKVDYRPNIGARALSGRQTYQFLMLYNNPNIGWMGELLIGVMNACRLIGYHLSIEAVGNFEARAFRSSVKPADVAGLIDGSRVDGVILPPPICFDPTVLEAIKEEGIPCVRFAGTPMHNLRLRVSIDNCAAGYEMTNHLIGLGHENIAIIKGPEGYVASVLRYEGFAAAMREHGLKVPRSNVTSGNFDVQSGNECARRLLRQDKRPTAIFASNDEMAAGALAAAQEAKISVPHQLSIAGFDDAHIALSVWPPLTTIRQPLRQMGTEAVELLANHIRQSRDDHEPAGPSSLTLDFELIVRKSTARCPDRVQ
jgi:LacI family transcriptional regulator